MLSVGLSLLTFAALVDTALTWNNNRVSANPRGAKTIGEDRDDHASGWQDSMSNPAGIELSVVIPAYNEEKTLTKTLPRIIGYLGDQAYSSEIIVVDDGSSDETGRVAVECLKGTADALVLSRRENKGKGYSVREGILRARGRYILFTDADLSTPIEELGKCLTWVEKGYDLVIGSRALGASQVRIPQAFIRRTMGKIFNLLVRLLILPGIKDTQCGFKLFRREAATDLFRRLRTRGFAFDVEVLYRARKSGYKIREVPVVWVNVLPSRVGLFSSSIRMLFGILAVRLRKSPNVKRKT